MNETATLQKTDKELEVLRNLHRKDSLRQRDLAEIVGLSLGMTNAIMKRLAVKGLLTVRKVNNRNIRYAVSPAGVEEIAKRSYKYFKKTIKNIVYYKNGIEELVRGVRREGFERVVLVGASDVDFIVEHLCREYGLGFRRRKDDAGEDGQADFFLYGENFAGTGPDRSLRRGVGQLRDVLMQL